MKIAWDDLVHLRPSRSTYHSWDLVSIPGIVEVDLATIFGKAGDDVPRRLHGELLVKSARNHAIRNGCRLTSRHRTPYDVLTLDFHR